MKDREAENIYVGGRPYWRKQSLSSVAAWKGNKKPAFAGVLAGVGAVLGSPQFPPSVIPKTAWQVYAV